MDLRHLRYFVTVSNERSFTRAAEKLYIAQPPLSRAIQQLEDDLGTQLIDREFRPLRLTPAGELLLAQATQLLARAESLREAMRRMGEHSTARFVIGFVPSVMYGVLPELVRRFRAVTPGLQIELLEMLSVDQVAALKDRRIDVGFGRLRVDDPDVRRDVLRNEPLVVGLPASHPLLKREGALPLAALAAEPLILYPNKPRPGFADLVLSTYRDRGFEPTIAYEANELQTAISLVAAEMGICIVPASVRRLHRDDVVYRDLDDAQITAPIIMSRRAEAPSRELVLMARVIADAYRQWNWPVPAGLNL